jgi:hypothetical protein
VTSGGQTNSQAVVREEKTERPGTGVLLSGCAGRSPDPSLAEQAVGLDLLSAHSELEQVTP